MIMNKEERVCSREFLSTAIWDFQTTRYLRKYCLVFSKWLREQKLFIFDHIFDGSRSKSPRQKAPVQKPPNKNPPVKKPPNTKAPRNKMPPMRKAPKNKMLPIQKALQNN